MCINTNGCSFGSRESHDTRLSTGSLWTRWAGTSVFTGASLSKKMNNTTNERKFVFEYSTLNEMIKPGLLK